MSIPVHTLGDWVDNMAGECDVSILLFPLKEIIIIWKATNFGLLNGPISDGTRNLMLKILTTQVVALQQELNCYPLGYDTAILFDQDGNVIP